MIIPFLLHTANRNIKGKADSFTTAFYGIKDSILSKHGKWIGYDIQHIPGKKCNSCGGRGQHAKYGHNGKIYDYADCYHCFGGWYKFPVWVCLRRIQYGRYIFHKPLKREECVRNPFTKESLGWEVTTNPPIKGYIEHDKHWFGNYAIFLLLFAYNRTLAKAFLKDRIQMKTYLMRWKIKSIKSSRVWLLYKPNIQIKEYIDSNFSKPYDDLPF